MPRTRKTDEKQLAFVFDAGPGFRVPIAVVVIRGLTTSTLLSLLVIPVLYEVVDDFIRRFSRSKAQGSEEAVSA